MKLLTFLTFIFFYCVCFSATEIQNYRLSTDATPTHYSIKIHPHVEEEFFEGDVSIYVTAKNLLDKITLHSADLNISEAYINRIAVTFEHEDDEKLSLRYANDSIQPGEHVVHIKYRGELNGKGVGFMKATYNYKEETGHLFVSDFQPASARKAFPCFDEPAFKSKFNIRLVAPNETYKAISNMQQINKFTTSEGIFYDFATSLPMSTYLVSFAITNYSYYEDVLEENDRKVPIRVYTFNASEENNQFTTNCTKTALQFYSEYTNISYPLLKLDMIEYERKQSAATENWGLITFRSGLLTLPLGKFAEDQIKIVMFHELAHFWFGNLVTNNWWNDLWLQEGLATYMSYKLYLKDTEINNQETKILVFNGFEEVISETPSNPIVYYLTAYRLLDTRFDKVVYEKAAYLLNMIEFVIGEGAFQEVVRTFLKRHAYKTATTNDFISTIEEIVPNMELRNFIESYLYQTRFPLINVIGSNGTYVLKQRAALTNSETANSGAKWTIPISYITNTNSTPTLKWFDKDLDELIIEEPGTKWLLFKKEDVGLYKVNYSSELWNTLFTDFQDLSLVESRLLINEAIYSFKFGIVDCHVFLNAMKKVKYHKQWYYLFEFHDSLTDRLACNGYKTELDTYMKFLTRRFNETNVAKEPHTYKPLCDNIKEADEKYVNLQTCVKWIKDNLSPDGNDIATK